MKREVAAKGGADGCIGPPRFCIDAVGHHRDSPGHFAGEMRIRNSLADCGYLVRKPTAQAVADSPSNGAGVGAVEGVNDHTDVCGQSRPAREPGGVGQERVDYIGRFLPDPTVEANPASRIGKAFAHLQGEKRDAGGCKLRGGIASSAGECDETDTPAAFLKPFGAEDGLAFRTADSVDAGNDEGNVVHRGRSRRVVSIRVS